MNHSDQRQMHQKWQQLRPSEGALAAVAPMSYATSYQSTPMAATMAATVDPAPTVSSPPLSNFIPAYQQTQQLQSQQQQQLHDFWENQLQEVEQTIEFKNHSLPLARIKKIMKADEDVRMISAEAPVVFAKACEMFILELTMRSWIHTEENKRRTLQKNDIAAAISRTDVFDFLVDIIPRDELKEEGIGISKGGLPLMMPHVDAASYYYVPQHHAPIDQGGLHMGQQVRPSLSFMAWPPFHAQQPPEERHPG